MLNLTAVVPVKSYLSRKQERSNEPAEVFPNQCQIDALAQCAIDSLHAVFGRIDDSKLSDIAKHCDQIASILWCVGLPAFNQSPIYPNTCFAEWSQRCATLCCESDAGCTVCIDDCAADCWLVNAQCCWLTRQFFLACFSCRCWSARGLSHTACTVSCMAFIQQ